MARGPDLFSRVELHRKTGIPDDVLNYWLREGVLRAREGGDGRGSPRRFDYPEITLAAILDELRGFGLNAAALKGLSDRFHEALDYFRARGLNRNNFYDLDELIYKQKREQEGDAAYGYTQDPAKYPQFEWKEVNGRRGGYVADVPFDELVDLPDLWRSTDSSDEDVQLVSRLARELDPEEYRAHYRYWSLLSTIDRKPSSLEAEHFARDSTGRWYLTPGDPAGRSWISIATTAINWELWQGDQSLRD